MGLKPAPRHKLAETVAQQLLAQVRSGIYEPGMRMPSERELMASLGVGRSTIREALNGLAVLGVIEIRHGQGAFVIQTDPATPPGALTSSLAKGVTRDLLEARVAVELTIAELAARRRTPTDIREIEAMSKSTRPCSSATSRRPNWQRAFTSSSPRLRTTRCWRGSSSRSWAC